MIAQTELLTIVKQGLSVEGTYNDAQLNVKVLAVTQYCINAGVSDAQLDTQLGYALITLGVSDIWQLDGECKFSKAFEMILFQLRSVS